jgi:hypothetical protein
MRTLAHKDADLKVLRNLHRQLLQDVEAPDLPFYRDLGAVLHDRNAMLAFVRKATADPAYRGRDELLNLADALGETDLAAAAMRESMERRKGFKEGHMFYGDYFLWWLAPYSGLRAHPEFKKLLIETGLAAYWRQTGKWGDGCKPVGADDFQCQ